MHLKYRSEIDGLRALAVVPVILFHAGFSWFSGGYVGVDVFFVISGYLITSIILGDLERGSFSLIAFYDRRARRILPALLFMLLIVSIAAWFILLPIELKVFSEGLTSVVLFASNVLFWRQTGYFSPLAGRNPLLHTWSLAVEEQYYIFFPIMLLFLWRYFRRHAAATIALGTIASLALAQWASSYAPPANFFLLPTRAWELGIGALCAIRLSRVPNPQFANYSGGMLGLIGLVLVVMSVFLFGADTPVPGVYGLLPTVGTALIILFATSTNLVGRVLSLKGVVGVGLISYSAYLWHQPLFALVRQFGSQIPPFSAVLLIGLTFLLAWFSWAYVERPIRSGARVSRARLFQLSILFSGTLIVVGIVGILTQGGEFRYSPNDRAFLEQGDYRISMTAFSYGKCFLGTDQSASDLVRNDCFPAGDGRPRLIIFGDSRAAQLSYGARQLFEKEGYQIVQWTAASCRPIIFSNTRTKCREFVHAFDDRVLPKLTAYDRVIIGANWGATYGDVGGSTFEREFRAGLRHFRTPAKLIIYDGGPSFFIQPIQTIFRKTHRSDGKALYADKVPYPASEKFVRDASRAAGFTYFNGSASLCPTDNRCLIYNGIDPIFLDAGHLSKAGSLIVMNMLLESKLFD